MNNNNFNNSKIKLDSTSILAVPLHVYNKDFTFVVNNREFKTSRIISDLISPIICRNHLNDPTFNRFVIDTQTEGDFTNILQLANFDQITISEEEIPFFCKVIEKLGTESFNLYEGNCEQINENNVFTLIKQHEKHGKFKSKRLESEIEFISSNFYKFCKNHKEDLENLQIDTLSRILNNSKLKLNDEDQLLKFINHIYTKDQKISFLYENVIFMNATSSSMNEFVGMFDLNDITNSTWQSICQRLKQEIEMNELIKEERYTEMNLISEKNGLNFPYSEENVFKGIINYLNNKSSGHIENEINITSSAHVINCPPINVTKFNSNQFFHSTDEANSWICFDFKNHWVIPTKYTIKSEYRWGQNGYYPKNWIIEGSNDGCKWINLDEEKDCSYLNGKSVHHTFDLKVENSKKFKFIRMKQTGQDWRNDNYLIFDSFEIYGKYI